MKMKNGYKLAAFLVFILMPLSSCALSSSKKEISSDDQQAIYQKCLKENMMVSVAWEMIEQNCKREAGLESTPSFKLEE